MDVAEILASIVERACLYVPEMPVGETLKRPKGLITRVQALKEEIVQVESPKEELSQVLKVPVVAGASNLVRFE